MKAYRREYPPFSLCGLNCGLCPRYQSTGASRCPGCGGVDFHLKHPSCAVITCSKKHEDVEYCFLCDEYPCCRYDHTGEKDSFITYRHVLEDMRKAMDNGMEWYQEQLNEKISFLEHLIERYNDGRKKNFYCIAVNLLPIEDLRVIADRMEKMEGTMPHKEKIKTIQAWLNAMAEDRGTDLKLRK